MPNLEQGIPDTADQQAPAATQIPTSPPAAPLGTATTGAGEEPVNLFEAAAAAGRGGNTGARGAAGAGADPGAEALAAAGGNLDFLRENPMFQQLRQLVQQQPQMLESVLQQVAGSNPQLAQLIASNPEQFLQLLAEGEEGDVPMPPGAQNISVTPEERDAIERVSSGDGHGAIFWFADSVRTAVPPWFRARPCHPGLLCL